MKFTSVCLFTKCKIIIIILLWLPQVVPITPQVVPSITREDFFNLADKTKLNENNKDFDLPIMYPHWADPTNKLISFVESGIIRFSGFDGINTLDIIVLATAQPIATNEGITVQRIDMPTPNQISEIKKEFKEGGSDIKNVDSFNPKGVLIFTWKDVEFYSGKKSSFQILLASDNTTRTMAIIKVESMTIPDWKLNFYPELDTRFSYKGGTKFKRGKFLKKAAEDTVASNEVKSGNQFTHDNAVLLTNSNKPGRWILDLSQDPDGNATTKSITILPSDVEVPDVNSTNVAVSGIFVLEKVTLDNSVIVEPNNNNEISVILSKKSKDARYLTLNENVLEWLNSVYQEATVNAKINNNSALEVVIVGYKPGSLVVEYSVVMPTDACGEKNRDACIDDVQNQVRNVTGISNKVKTRNMESEINEAKTDFLDLDECTIDSERSDKLFCDRNAYCVEYKEKGAYACICKNGYTGDGKVGNCKKDERNPFIENLPIIGGVGGTALAVILFIVMAVAYVKKKEEETWQNRRTQAEHMLPKHMIPKKGKRTTVKEKGTRSTRKVLVPAPYGLDFDIYHRT